MYSNIVPFENILERIKDDTGITSLRNLLPKIRRLIYRVEHEIGYGGSVLLRRVKYSVEAGTILFDGYQYKLKLPNDVVHLEAIGMCQEDQVCPGDYRIQGNWMFFCKGHKITGFSLLYYTLLTDGEGNPVTTENHFEAVASGVSMYLYRAKRFNDKGSRATYKDMEEYYHDRIGEARGDDFWPSTIEEWSRAASMLRWSSRDTLLYSETERCFCEVPESILTSVVDPGGTTGGGGGYTGPATGAPGGGGSGDGGGGTDGNGSYEPPIVVDPNEPTDPTDPTEPVNQPPTIDDITFYTTSGFTTPITWAMFVEGAPAPYNDTENDLMDAVRLDGLKFDNKGKWFYQGKEVGIELEFGEILFKANFDAGELIHIAWNESDFNHDVLYFSVRDSVNGNWVN